MSPLDTDLATAMATAAVEHAVLAHAPEATSDALERAAAALADARSRLREALADDDQLLPVLAARAGLSPDELELVTLLATVEQSEPLQRLVVSLTADRERHRVELWMLSHLLPGATPATAGPASRLVRSALVEHRRHGAFGRTALVVAPRLLWALWGDPRPDPSLPVGSNWASVGHEDFQGDESADAVLVVGADRVRRRQRALVALKAEHGLVTPPPADDAAWAAVVREATLAGAAVVLEAEATLDRAARHWLAVADHLPVAITTASALPLDDLPDRDWRELSPAAAPVSRSEWTHVAGTTEQPHALTAEQLARLERAMHLTGGDAEAAYRRLTDPRIDSLASRVVPQAGWDELVLSPGRKQRLRDLVDRYRTAAVVYGEWGLRPSPSRGLVALFSGKSGTGKTMGAEVVAGELGLDMYRLDLSAVVSKYIGETEKNLDELFDAAAIGGTVLFFDEADSMFGKRTEVSDAHDRYANVGTSYLLQRLERYDGIVVLATNYEKNIDDAFLRRVHVRVDFPLPGEAEREQLWRQNLAAGMPVADGVDVAWLVDGFELSGAGIRNTVVDAAFLAARDGSEVTMAHLVQGLARELSKSSMRITRERFGDWYDLATQSSSG